MIKKLLFFTIQYKFYILGFVFLVFSFFLLSRIYFSSINDLEINSEQSSLSTAIYMIDVEISGEVVNAGFYQMQQNANLGDLIEKAGGFTNNYDKEYVEKNINLADILFNGQKINIPSISNNQSDVIASYHKININTCTFSDLDALWGIGEKRANSIINNRPFMKIEELYTRKIIPKSVFEKIKDEISIN